MRGGGAPDRGRGEPAEVKARGLQAAAGGSRHGRSWAIVDVRADQLSLTVSVHDAASRGSFDRAVYNAGLDFGVVNDVSCSEADGAGDCADGLVQR